MKILIVGNGGREHALAWKAAQSAQVEKVYVAPGNAGTAGETRVENKPIGAEDITALKTFALDKRIDLTIVGPEAPLVAGIVDSFQADNLAIFGPTKAAARLEGSKLFSKEFLTRHQIPTAKYAQFTNVDDAVAHVRQQGVPIVIKADGLAAGKGVTLADTEAQATSAITNMLIDNAFGKAGHRIIIEELLHGEEASFICMVDGQHILPLATSQDHKARDNGDTGPNTGGMGAYSPAPVITHRIYDRIMKQIIEPTVAGMAAEGYPYMGFLYAGLMITPDGIPKVLEYNCRFGDPETQPIVMRLQSDLIALCQSALETKLNSASIRWDHRPALGVVAASEGYPGNYERGKVIDGLSGTDGVNTKVFHAGTEIKAEHVVTNGGRVLCVTSLGDSVSDAQQQAYQSLKKIQWQGLYYRTDIGHRAVARERESKS